jgi:hypothetical protein
MSPLILGNRLIELNRTAANIGIAFFIPLLGGERLGDRLLRRSFGYSGAWLLCHGDQRSKQEEVVSIVPLHREKIEICVPFYPPSCPTCKWVQMVQYTIACDEARVCHTKWRTSPRSWG